MKYQRDKIYDLYDDFVFVFFSRSSHRFGLIPSGLVLTSAASSYTFMELRFD